MSHQLSESKYDKKLVVDGDGRSGFLFFCCFVLLQVMIGGTSSFYGFFFG
jgi:hypothetical protein